MMKQKVNDKCLCGSGKKYKKCCMNKLSNVISRDITSLEKQEISLMIEGIESNMEISLFTNQCAKKYINKIIKNKTLLEDDFYMHVNRWLDEPRDVKCYSLSNKNNVTNIILLSKCDYDPQKGNHLAQQHKIPYILDYIYTFLEYRRNNFAYEMLLHIKKNEEITTFCSNIESENLFKKAEYIFNGYDKMLNILPVFRYP